MEIDELVSILTDVGGALKIAVFNVEDEQGKPLRQWKLFASMGVDGEIKWHSTYVYFKNVSNPYIYKKIISPKQALGWILSFHKSVKIVHYNGM